MNIFITGGSGFVGGRLISALSKTHTLHAMARSESSAAVVAERGAKPVRSSLSSVTAADLRGMDVVIHAAAYVEEWGPQERFVEVNVRGTEQLLQAAQEAGVERFILISTNAVVLNGTDQLDVDEAYTPSGQPDYPYSVTKAAAERAVLAANREGFFTVAIRPCFIWGPDDTSFLPKVTAMVQQGRFVWLDGGQKATSTTHIDNLVSAVACALTQGRGGEAYFVADEDAPSLKTFLTGLVATQGVSLPGVSLPGAVVRPLAGVIEGVWSLLGIHSAPPVTRFSAALMSTAMTVSTDKARQELSWEPIIQRQEALAAMA